MDEFQAAVQYNDFKGTCAADRSDNLALRKRLIEEGLATEDERVVGIRFCFFENSKPLVEDLGIVVYVAEAIEYPKKVRSVELDLPAAEFFGFFKRLDVVMTLKGQDLSQAEIEGPRYG